MIKPPESPLCVAKKEDGGFVLPMQKSGFCPRGFGPEGFCPPTPSMSEVFILVNMTIYKQSSLKSFAKKRRAETSETVELVTSSATMMIRSHSRPQWQMGHTLNHNVEPVTP